MNNNRWSSDLRTRALNALFAAGRSSIETKRYCPDGITSLRARGYVISLARDGRWLHELTASGRAARDQMAEAR